METKLSLHEKLSKIQKEFKANKSKFNSFGKYNFRSAEDILEALKPFNEKYGVSFLITETLITNSNHGFPIIESTATILDNNGINELSATAIVGIDMDMKGTQTPQKFGSASSYGKKYALGNLLLIDDTQDADATNTHGKADDDKKWLNLNTPEFKKAVDYINSGGSIDVIEKKYKLAAATKEALLKK